MNQNSFDEVDTYTSLHKQEGMLKLIFIAYEYLQKAIDNEVPVDDCIELDFMSKIGKAKFILEKEFDEKYKEIVEEIKTETQNLIEKGDK